MFILKFMVLALCLPFTWISAIVCRRLPFEKRYAKLTGWCNRVLRISGVNFEVIEEAQLPSDEALFFVSNHQGTGDPLVIVAALRTPMTFVSKIENKKIPILNSWAKSVEMIYFDRNDTNSAIHMLRESARYLKRKRNLLIFPEGTRSQSATMNAFKNGSIKPAFLGKATIVPITQINSYNLWDIMKKGSTLRIVIGTPIPYSEYKGKSVDELGERIQKQLEANLLKYKI